MPQALKSCPKSNKLPNLVTLILSYLVTETTKIPPFYGNCVTAKQVLLYWSQCKCSKSTRGSDLSFGSYYYFSWFLSRSLKIGGETFFYLHFFCLSGFVFTYLFILSKSLLFQRTYEYDKHHSFCIILFLSIEIIVYLGKHRDNMIKNSHMGNSSVSFSLCKWLFQ